MREAGQDVLLGDEDLKAFETGGRCFPRTAIVEKSPAAKGGWYERGEPASDELAVEVATRLMFSEFRSGPTFGGCIVRVNSGDGMTWSAHACFKALKNRNPQIAFRLFGRNRGLGVLPEIMDLVPTRDLLKLAVRHGLLRRWSRIPSLLAFVGVASAFAIVMKFLDLYKNQQGAAVAVFGGLLTVIAPLITKRLQANWKKDRAITDLAGRVAKDDAAVEAFIEDLALDLLPSHEVARVVIIDHYQLLDSFSRRVVKRFFHGPDGKRKRGPNRTGEEWFRQPVSERWLVFEESGGGEPLIDPAMVGNGPRVDATYVMRQEYLDSESRRKLSELVGRPENASYHPVKSVCRTVAAESDARVSQAVEDYRKRHPPAPETLDALDLLFLLAVASEDCPFRFDAKALANELAPESMTRARLLRLLFRGARLTQAEVHGCVEDLLDRFKGIGLLDAKVSRRSTIVEMNSDKVGAVLHESGALGLPDPRHGHLFWALFWFERLRRGVAPEAGEMHGLCHHVRAANPALPAGKDRDLIERDVRAQLFEAVLFAIDGCLRTCLLREVPALIKRALDLLDLEPTRDTQADRLRVARVAWEAHAIFASSEVLDLAVAATSGQRTPSEESLPTSTLDGFYCDATPLDEQDRALLERALSVSERGITKGIRPFVEHARIRAAWYVLSLDPKLLVPLEGTRLAEVHARALSDIDHLMQGALAAAEGVEEDSLPIATAVTLSLVVWCQAIRCTGAIRQLTLSRMQAEDASATPPDATTGTTMQKWFASLERDFAVLHESVARAFRIAERFGQTAEHLDRDYLRGVVGRELTAVSLAALIIAHRGGRFSFGDTGAAGLDIFGRAAEAVRAGFGTEIEMPVFGRRESWDKLTTQAADCLGLCNILWEGLGVESSCASLALRRFQFQLLAVPRQEDAREGDRVVASARKTAPYDGTLGLLADLLQAANLTHSGEIAAYHLCRTVRSTLEVSYGEQLKHELSFLAINQAHVFGFEDLPVLLEHLMSRSRNGTRLDGGTGLVWLLQKIPPRALSGALLGLYNAARASGKDGAFVSTVDAWQSAIRSPEAQAVVRRLVSLFRLAEDVEAGRPVDAAARVREWEGERDSWLYAWVLLLLLDSGHANAAIYDESVRVLQRDPRADTSNVYLNLAMRLAPHFPDPSENGQVAVQYVEDAIPRWSQQVRAEINVQAYTLLWRRRPTIARYRDEVGRWQLIMFERDQLRLADLTRRGQHFLVFSQYCHSMALWGLAIRKPAAAPAAETGAAIREFLDSWLDGQSQVPEPFTPEREVNGEFLRLGSALFAPGPRNEERFAEAREQVDLKASGAVKTLLTMIALLPGLPPDLHDLMRSHAARRQPGARIDLGIRAERPS